MEKQKINVFYYFFSYRNNAAENSTRLLRSLTAQVIQKFPDLAGYVHDEYVLSHSTASLRALRKLLPNLLISAQSSRLVVDGIDECDPDEQKFIIEHILELLPTGTSSHICKILVSSRDVPTVSRNLRKKIKIATEISLSREHQSVDNVIECFIQKRLLELQDDIGELEHDGAVVDNTRRTLAEKANGKHGVETQFENFS